MNTARNFPVLRKTILVTGIVTLTGILFYGLQKESIHELIKTLTITRHTLVYDRALFTPEFVVIHLRDSVTIKNNSQTTMEIAVGRHENHKNLSGFQEKVINPKEEYTFTPRERGVFDLHDHFNPKNLGYLIVDK